MPPVLILAAGLGGEGEVVPDRAGAFTPSSRRRRGRVRPGHADAARPIHSARTSCPVEVEGEPRLSVAGVADVADPAGWRRMAGGRHGRGAIDVAARYHA